LKELKQSIKINVCLFIVLDVSPYKDNRLVLCYEGTVEKQTFSNTT